jgi:hypothetical protein
VFHLPVEETPDPETVRRAFREAVDEGRPEFVGATSRFCSTAQPGRHGSLRLWGYPVVVTRENVRIYVPGTRASDERRE